MNSHGLTRENLVATLPPALQKDPSAVALAEAMADLLAQRPEEIEQLRIYPVIDRLDERLLDILAYDFKVDWWDADYSLEEKRRTLKDSWRVHKLLGTKAAVEMAISAIYPQTTVQEWFEYGGRPYHFKLQLDLTGTFWTEERPRRILERVNFYKSLRSHVDGLEYTRYPAQPARLYVGGAGGILSTMGIPQDTGLPEPSGVQSRTIYTGGTFAARTVLPVPEDSALPGATTILRTGGVCTIISNLSGGSD
jgi:phage tail P2-like protein